MLLLLALVTAALLAGCAPAEIASEPEVDDVADEPEPMEEPAESAEDPDPTAEPESDEGYTEDDIEFKLAIVAEGSSAYGDQDRIAVYADALDRAEDTCQDDREMIADMTVRAVQLVEEQDGAATHLEMLAALSEAVPHEMRPADCAEIYAALITLMVSS